MPSLFAQQALLPDGWARDVRFVFEGARIATMTVGAAPAAEDERCVIAVPGMASLHSHAFQRGMAGLAEVRGPSADTFWTWRDTMYRFALSVSPDDVEAIATWLYIEMLEAGFTRVGEFHYLHHDHDGRPYANIAELAERHAAAATASGIGLTLLPSFYAHATFGGAPPHDGQRRFICSLDQFARLIEATDHVIKPLDGANLGVAPHSLRAITPEELHAVVALAGNRPIHIHAAEQVKEVADCVAWSGRRPVEWLLANAAVDARWCLIHATHMTEQETLALAKAGAVAGLCPVTEASLGDGVFPARDYLAAGGRFGIGTDSNILVGVADELRQLEYGQRLTRHERNVLAGDNGASSGRRLYNCALSGGTAALAQPTDGLVIGARADVVTLSGDHPSLAGRRGDALLDGWLFAGGRDVVDGVWAGGVKRVADGRHVSREAAKARFNTAIARLV